MTQAIIIFKGNPYLSALSPDDAVLISPCVYLAWHGAHFHNYLQQLAALMVQRPHDPYYACARFIGICHINDINHMNLGCWATPQNVENAIRILDDELSLPGQKATAIAALNDYSPGDYGLIVVDTSDFSFTAYNSSLNGE